MNYVASGVSRSTMSDDEWQARVDLAAAHRLAVMHGLNEGIFNHFTLRVPGKPGRYYQIPFGLHWSEITASCFMEVSFDGERLAGEGEIERSCYCIHAPIHRDLPDAAAVFHTHMPYASALARLEDQRILPIGQTELGTLIHTAYDDHYDGPAFDPAEGARLAKVIGDKTVLMMANHGVGVVGRNVAEAYDRIYYVERVAQVQLYAMWTNRPLRHLPQEVVDKTVKGMAGGPRYGGRRASEWHFDALKRILDRKEPDYRADRLTAPVEPDDDLPEEFARIARHFRPLAGPAALGLRDDAAVLLPPPGRELVLTCDAMVAGVHFLPDDPPALVGRKLLRVNLSDLAAKGATPLGYLMTVSTPRATPDAWFAGFAAGLAEDQASYGVTLLGGDTTSTPGPISLSLTILGHVSPGEAVRRDGARDGDGVWVTGTIGDGALGLAVATGGLADPSGHLLARYRLPEPRLGLPLAGIASACLDVSDGLVQDLGHLCRAGGIGAAIDASLVPLSAPARAAGPEWLATCLTGGDDYELLMAVPPANEAALARAAGRAGIVVTRIGRFAAGQSRVTVRGPDGAAMRLDTQGWSHF